MPRATVIMRAKNADWVIGQALCALFSQDYTDFELLVVDSGSTDRTLELVQSFPHRLRRISGGDYFPGRVLNDAISGCTSEIIVFQNSDAVPLTPAALGRLVAAFDDPQVVAALARQVPRPEAEPWVRRDYAASFPDAAGPAPWITLSLPLAAIRRSAWRERPFYTDAWGSEDTEWGAWALSRGYRIAYVKDALVMHSHNYTLRELEGRRFIEGEADAFIHQARPSALSAAVRAVAATARDLVVHGRARDLGGLARVPLRQAVSHLAYLRGLAHGSKRCDSGDGDASVGQREALSRHESSRELLR